MAGGPTIEGKKVFRVLFVLIEGHPQGTFVPRRGANSMRVIWFRHTRGSREEARMGHPSKLNSFSFVVDLFDRTMPSVCCNLTLGKQSQQ